ncbi:MAG: RNA pseudouridine synthase [Saprospiraceae bacterium]|nr:RNA pseudouridine synthase [Saprospiraceae bacterium]
MEEQIIRPGDLVLYKDQQIIALNKPAGMPVQADQSGAKSLFDLAEIYAKKNLYLTNRLDRPVAGLVLFGKNAQAAAAIHQQLQDRSLNKTYLAITGKKLPKDSGQLIHHIKKDGTKNRSLALDNPDVDTQEAILNYDLIDASDRYFLYKVELLTGRHHQIRAQFGQMGCPIRGDEKYGFKRQNKDRSIDLFCWKMEFTHPTGGDRKLIEAPIPDLPLWNAFAEKIKSV